MSCDCLSHPLNPPIVVGIAADNYLTPKHRFADAAHLGNVRLPERGRLLTRQLIPLYGQDLTFGRRRRLPDDMYSAGDTARELESEMKDLLDVFAYRDTTGMARRLFDAFLVPNRRLAYFSDRSLTAAASNHANIQYFCSATVSAPGSPHRTQGKVRVHQALQHAGWDITRLHEPVNLGVPAFNIGDKAGRTGDYANGLGLMINGVQHVYVLATHYHYDPNEGRYSMRLRFLFYDVFGLDRDDADVYGLGFTSNILGLDGPTGISAWWQLQHQYGYAPLVTRFVLDKDYEFDAT